MAFSNQILPFVKRNPAITALATVALVASAYFVIKGGGNNDILQKWDTCYRSHGSGACVSSATKAYMTSSGSLSLSGNLIVEGAVNVGGSGLLDSALLGSGAVIREGTAVLSNPGTLAVTGTTILSFKLRAFSGTLIGVHASATTAGSGTTIDVNLGGDTALGTKLTIDEDETDSDTATTPAAITSTADNKASNETIVIDVDTCGNTSLGATCPKGLSVNLVFKVSSFAY